MAEDNAFQGEMDPELAAMLGNIGGSNDDAVPNYAEIFQEEAGGADNAEAGGTAEPAEAAGVDLNVEHFPEITKKFEDTPHKAFEDPDYYKTALGGEGDISQRVNGILQKMLTTKDPKDRGVFRQQFIPAYWDFLSNVAKRASGKMPDPKKYLLRFALLHSGMLTGDNRTLFAKIIEDNTLNQPIYYLDEWFKAIGNGSVRPSTTDEAKVSQNNVSAKLKQLIDKAQGKLDGAKSLIKAKADEKIAQEKQLIDKERLALEHFPMQGLPDINACFNDGQKRAISDMQEVLKAMLRSDHDLEMFRKDYDQAEEDLRGLKEKAEAAGGVAEVDTGAIDTEFGTIRQMAKMTIGRQGNQFPLLANEYFHNTANDIGCRENVLSVLTWIESIDPEAFFRVYKNRNNRIVPYVILIPSYGDYGMCWEPYDRFNRATSRGRIAVPMYPKNLQFAVLYAVADLRWQVAKEKASFYWMEEGITGHYYQWFQKMKMKGDVKLAFIEDYILWLTKESEGTMKLDKELRGTFWRYMPFSQPVKEKLKNRSFAYQELYQRDINRTMSDGY